MDHSSLDGSSQSPKEDPTHTSYEFTLPYTTKKEDTASQDQQQKQQEEKVPKITPIESGESLAFRARGLAGKFVDEFGNILDWDGTVVGSVQGDLPSMVGRPVSESGEVLDSSGEVVGYVSENHADPPPLKELQGGLKVDEAGNIYNHQGVIVGKMNNNSDGKPQTREGANAGSGTKTQNKANEAAKASTPSPSEVYLDVKSTHEGIQLIIKIPTVFNK
ncbi:hypothetical protein PT974_07745 [Cladobotryum mycophilum]|uniref:Uncharacterized protein n=1 Tax=Cladobotryum mycophilum TaxID=491253 RepID=A0ABR0SIP3_9HYPO